MHDHELGVAIGFGGGVVESEYEGLALPDVRRQARPHQLVLVEELVLEAGVLEKQLLVDAGDRRQTLALAEVVALLGAAARVSHSRPLLF